MYSGVYLVHWGEIRDSVVNMFAIRAGTVGAQVAIRRSHHASWQGDGGGGDEAEQVNGYDPWDHSGKDANGDGRKDGGGGRNGTVRHLLRRGRRRRRRRLLCLRLRRDTATFIRRGWYLERPIVDVGSLGVRLRPYA